MKKISKITASVLLVLLAVLFAFSGCSTPIVIDDETTSAVTTTEPATEETTQPDPNAEITISDEVIDFVEDTDDAIEKGEDVASDDVIKGDIEQEQEVNDEGLLETDGTVEQENISYDGTNTGKGKSLLSGAATLTYYNQADSRWGYILYTNHGDRSQTIKSSGCGPTSAAMVISASKGIVTPPTIAKLFVDNGYRTYSNGTAWSAWSFVADYFDFNEYHTTSSFSTMKSYLKQDKNKDGIADYFVVCSCGSGLFTTGGHYIFLAGDKDGTITVYDPYYYYGKFNTASRKGANVKVSGNIAYVTETNFYKYGNVKQYWIYSNDGSTTKPDKDKQIPEKDNKDKQAKKTMYVTASWLNVRKGPGTNYAIVDCIKNGTKVTVYETKNGWSRIGTNKWVSSTYLSATAPKSTQPVKYKTTVNSYYWLNSNATLYSKGSLSGTTYSYLKGTKLKVLSHYSSTVDYIYIPATGRKAYCKVSNFT